MICDYCSLVFYLLLKLNMKVVIYIILIAIVVFIVRKFLSQFKVAKIGSLALVTGGVKTGKSTLSVSIVRSEYKRRYRRIKFKNFFCKLFNKPLYQLPLLYSNVPLGMPYVQITEDLLLRKKRFEYGSVIYIQEASLVADSQLIRDMDINERLMLFNKLIGHETKGGVLIYDTQCITDVHYSIKRCISNYFYIHHLVKWIPFFLIAYVQECRYSDDGTTLTISNEDVENTLKRVILRKSTWKYFDCYCYSILTDDLPVENTIIYNDKKTKDLKARKILSFRKLKNDGLIDKTSGGGVSERENSKKSI